MNLYDKKSTLSYTLGTTLTIELLLTKKEQARCLYISPKQHRDETYEKLVRLAKASSIPVIENNEKIFKLSDKDNVMAIGAFEKWDDELDVAAPHVVLVNPSNMGNLGTILRAMAAFSYRDLAIIEPACDPFDPKTIRASMGAIFHVRMKRYPSFAAYEAEYQKRTLYPMMLQAERYLPTIAPESPYTLVFGNEATGLPREFLQKGIPLKIPQTDKVDSLNLDNAVAITLYAFSQKTTA